MKSTVKDDYIKIRVTKKQKKFFKEIAKAEGMSMSEFIIVNTENIANRKAQNKKFKSMIERRAQRTEEKLLELKNKLIKNR